MNEGIIISFYLIILLCAVLLGFSFDRLEHILGVLKEIRDALNTRTTD